MLLAHLLFLRQRARIGYRAGRRLGRKDDDRIPNRATLTVDDVYEEFGGTSHAYREHQQG